MKKDECSYIEELDKITKETKAKRDLQDKEIVEKVKLKQKSSAPVIGDSGEINPAPKKARIAHKAGDVVVSCLVHSVKLSSSEPLPDRKLIKFFSFCSPF